MRRVVRRLAQLYAGLALYGLGISLQVSSGLGNDPWDVLHQGLSRYTGLAIGTWVNIAAVGVLLLWIPLRQRPGLGTISNAVLIGTFVNVFLPKLPPPGGLPVRWAYLVAAILTVGMATGCYIGAGFGPGPRDGLMTGLATRGHSLRLVRTCIELTVLTAGWLLGGTVGAGTLLYAVSIGPLAQFFLRLLSVPPRERPGTLARKAPAAGNPAMNPPGPRAPETETAGSA